MAYIGAGISRFNTADELTVTGDAQIDGTTLVIDSTNNRVGVGTASPATALDVTGTVTADQLNVDNIRIDGNTISSTDTNGNVNIDPAGTGSIVAAQVASLSLDIEGDRTDAQITLKGGSAGAGIQLFGSTFTNYAGAIYLDATASTTGTNDAQMVFRTGSSPSEAMRIDRSGNVGIGTSSPDRNFHVESGGDTYVRVSGNRGNGNDLHIGNVEFENAFGSQGVVAEIKALTGNSGTQSTKGQLAFYTDDGSSLAERLRVDAAGNLLVGTTTNGTTADGTVIRASAETLMSRSNGAPLLVNRRGSDGAAIEVRNDNTVVGYINANASGMGVYLGGTAAANHLDDYETGSATLTYTGDSNPTVVYAQQAAEYVKVGDFVIVCGRLRTSSVSSQGSGGLRISGLPFTVDTGQIWGSVNIGYATGWPTGNTPATGYAEPGTTRCDLIKSDSDPRNGLDTSVSAGSLTTGAGNDIIFTITYKTS